MVEDVPNNSKRDREGWNQAGKEMGKQTVLAEGAFLSFRRTTANKS